MDFTISTYKKLLCTILSSEYNICSFDQYIEHGCNKKCVILREDVDTNPVNSLKFAQIQYDMGIRSSFYFRIVPESWDEKIIKEIDRLGHEIGYHYEDVDLIFSKNRNIDKNDLLKKAIESFKLNLERFRTVVPISTICMHGSPLSRYDNKMIWDRYNYHDFGLIGEPYFDIDFSKVAYYTDTGRRWDGNRFSVRDKAFINPERKVPRFPRYNSTVDLINDFRFERFPEQAMLTFHPQRWTNKPLPWVKELFFQNGKNVVKYFLVNREK